MRKVPTNNQHLFYQPKDVWVGDVMPFGKDGTFYLYHQRDTRDPAPLAEGQPFGWSLATTQDFVTYQEHGTAIPHGGEDDQDQFIYAGTVYEAKGEVRAFYTGFNRNYLREGKTSQVLMQAKACSDDYATWKKTGVAVELTPQPGYDGRNWRDPFVIWDDDRKEYLLVLGTRKGDDPSKTLQTGRLVHFTSKDLEHWQFKGDFWAPGLYTMFEMPDIFKIGDWWYLVYSEYSDENKIVYRMSRDLYGPWEKPRDDAFDGRAYYAGRTAFDGSRRILSGWVPTRENDDDRANWLWGGSFMPHEVYQRPNGTLGVRPPQSIKDAFECPDAVPDIELRGDHERTECVITENAGEIFCFEADVTFRDACDFSIRAYKNLETDESYEYRFDLDANRLSFDKSPCYKWFRVMDKGLWRPVWLESGRSYHLQLIVDDNILVLYLDGTALTTRVCEKFGYSLAVTVTNGELKLSNIALAKGLREQEK